MEEISMNNEILQHYRDILIYVKEHNGLMKKNVWLIKCPKCHLFLIKSNTNFNDNFIKDVSCPTCINSEINNSMPVLILPDDEM